MQNELFPQGSAAVEASSAEFKLSITRALADQLAASLSDLKPAPLTAAALADLKNEPGVYELSYQGRRVYVGKASRSLPNRLGKHLRKLSGRSGIDMGEVKFVCLYVEEDLDAAGPEKMLIKKYGEDGAPWNKNGFGNNDPGRKRDDSLVKRRHFDAVFPVNLDFEIGPVAHGTGSVSSFLGKVKRELPFNLRFETKSSNAKELAQSKVALPVGDMTLRDVVRLVIDALPEGWQATALPGYVIIYREETTYESAKVIWRKQNNNVIEVQGQGLLDDGEVEEEPDNDED